MTFEMQLIIDLYRSISSSFISCNEIRNDSNLNLFAKDCDGIWPFAEAPSRGGCSSANFLPTDYPRSHVMW